MKQIDSKIVNISIFKNGLSLITHEAIIPSSGEYYITDAPSPIHGTFWFDDDVNASCALKKIELQKDVNPPGSSDVLFGNRANVQILRDENLTAETINCKIIKTVVLNNNSNKTYLLVQPEDSDKQLLLDESYIKSIQIDKDPQHEVKKQIIEKVVLALQVQCENTTRVRFTYVSSGIVWSPAYKVDTTDDTSLKLTLQAIVKNELCDLVDTNIELISGFPNFEFRNVISPLSTNSIDRFFSMLENRNDSSLDRDQCAPSTYASPDQYSVAGAGSIGTESADLYFKGIGTHVLNAGDALFTIVAESCAKYRRIIEWLIPDARQSDGQFIRSDPYRRRRQDQVSGYDEGAWDSLIFSNPFDHPMTAAPVEIVEGGRFRGQSLTYWANPGEEVLLRVTKALSIKTSSIEQEEPDSREVITWGGYRFQETRVKGELLLSNRRKECVDVLIRRRFTGRLEEADMKPELKLQDEGTVSINPKNELRWSVRINGGEILSLKYSYVVWVRFDSRDY